MNDRGKAWKTEREIILTHYYYCNIIIPLVLPHIYNPLKQGVIFEQLPVPSHQVLLKKRKKLMGIYLKYFFFPHMNS